MTIVLSTSFKSTTETQISKLQEDSQRSFAAAQAGIDAALKKGDNVNIADLKDVGNFTGSAQITTDNTKTVFVSPLQNKDQEYTFYLDNYNNSVDSSGNSSWSFANSPYSGNVRIFYGSENGSNCSQMALAITIIYGDSPTYQVTNYIADGGRMFNGNQPNNIFTNISGGPYEGANFICSTSNISFGSGAGAIAKPKIMVVRFISTGVSSTKLAFVGSGGGPLKAQGKVVESTATSDTNVTKKVRLFQSYPQIPAEFFVTSF
jgi:hypothetical protein